MKNVTFRVWGVLQTTDVTSVRYNMSNIYEGRRFLEIFAVCTVLSEFNCWFRRIIWIYLAGSAWMNPDVSPCCAASGGTWRLWSWTWPSVWWVGRACLYRSTAQKHTTLSIHSITQTTGAQWVPFMKLATVVHLLLCNVTFSWLLKLKFLR